MNFISEYCVNTLDICCSLCVKFVVLFESEHVQENAFTVI